MMNIILIIESVDSISRDDPNTIQKYLKKRYVLRVLTQYHINFLHYFLYQFVPFSKT